MTVTPAALPLLEVGAPRRADAHTRLSALDRALSADGLPPLSRWVLAQAHLGPIGATIASGDFVQAEVLASLALGLDPSLPALWNNRAVARASRGELVGALGDVDEALRLDPERVPALVNRASWLLSLGDLARADPAVARLSTVISRVRAGPHPRRRPRDPRRSRGRAGLARARGGAEVEARAVVPRVRPGRARGASGVSTVAACHARLQPRPDETGQPQVALTFESRQIYSGKTSRYHRATSLRTMAAKSQKKPSKSPGIELPDVAFYRANERPYGMLSNLFRRPIFFEGREFPTAEHAYQAGKPRRDEVREWLLNAPSPSLLAMAAHGLYVWDIAPNWSRTKYDRMRGVLRAKFTQHLDLRDLLLSTGDARLVETATVDNLVNRTWGEVNGKGQNMLGKLLMELRMELRASTTASDSPRARERGRAKNTRQVA